MLDRCGAQAPHRLDVGQPLAPCRAACNVVEHPPIGVPRQCKDLTGSGRLEHGAQPVAQVTEPRVFSRAQTTGHVGRRHEQPGDALLTSNDVPGRGDTTS